MNRRLFVLLSLLCMAADWSKHPNNEWVKQSPTDKQPAPMIGWEGSGAYDPFSKKWIHFGGHDGIPQGFHLFTYDLETRLWEQRFPPNSPAGVCCIDGANTFDVANRRFVNFPGGSLGHGYQWSRGVYLRRSAAWLYDPAMNTWTNMRPPPYRRPYARGEYRRPRRRRRVSSTARNLHHLRRPGFAGRHEQPALLRRLRQPVDAHHGRQSAEPARRHGHLRRYEERLRRHLRQPVRQR
jgi:hypothetical protein